MKSKQEIVPLPYLFYFIPVVLLAVVGLLDSVYLSISHYRVYTDIGYKSFCAISRAINCDTVSQSRYSIFLNIPVPVWGIVGYCFFLLLLFFAWKQDDEDKPVWTLLFLTALAFSGYSMILAFISAVYIQSYCIMCLLSFGVNFFLLYFTWIIRKRFHIHGLIDNIRRDVLFLWKVKKKSVPLMGIFITGLFFLFVLIPDYWTISLKGLPRGLPVGITAEGHPWIGAENPILEIMEFTDYQCFQCRKMHFFIRNLVGQYPDKIRLIHRHYPMDHQFNPIVKEPFHIGAGSLALLAIHATKKGKFWELNDLLFDVARQEGEVNVKELSVKIGLNEKDLSGAFFDPETRAHLNFDIRSGLKLGINGTPVYLINDKLYLGQLPADVLSKVVE
ncbi:MAG: vitamin K epoxide reductase family protein [Pseudomonadota bacterium]